MSALFKLKKTIGRTYDSDPDDTLKVKEALERLGYYETPDYGMTPHTDDQMFWAVEEFQRDFNLKVDGVVKPDNQTATYMGEVLNHKELIDEAKKSPPK